MEAFTSPLFTRVKGGLKSDPGVRLHRGSKQPPLKMAQTPAHEREFKPLIQTPAREREFDLYTHKALEERPGRAREHGDPG